MRIVVTGGAGFIGSHLVDRLLADGHQVMVLDDFSTGKRANLPSEDPNLRIVDGDVTDPLAAQAASDGCQACFHLAAVASVQASIEEPIRVHRTNLIGTLTMLQAAVASGTTRFVYASSAAVYGDVQDLPVKEDAPKNPLSPYAIDKLAGEHYLAHFHRAGLLHGVALRFFNVFGPRQDPSSPYSGVISIFAERGRAGQPITVHGDGRQTRDFVFVHDVVDQLVGALRFPRNPAMEAYNVGTGRAVSLLDLLAAFTRLLGPLEITHDAARSGDIRHSLADISKLRAVADGLGIGVPQTPLQEGLAAIVEASG